MQNINIRDNPKKAWGLISAIDGKNATKGSIGPLQDPQGNLVTADQDKADLLAQQYYHVSSDQNLDPVFLEKRNKQKQTYSQNAAHRSRNTTTLTLH